MTDLSNVRLAAVDGTDALAFVLIRPGKTEGGVSIEAAANGMSQPAAAYVLRHVAEMWDAEQPADAAPATPETPSGRRILTKLEHDRAWHVIEGAAGEPGADPSTILRAVLYALRIDAPPTEAVPEHAPATDRADLRDRIAAEVAAVFSSGKSLYDPGRQIADAVLAVLPAPADRAAALREVLPGPYFKEQL